MKIRKSVGFSMAAAVVAVAGAGYAAAGPRSEIRDVRSLTGGDTHYSCNSRPCPPLCLTQACAYSDGTCTEWRYNPSFDCVLDPNGPLNSCTSKPKNEGCKRQYSNPCVDPAHPACTVLSGDCDSAYQCL